MKRWPILLLFLVLLFVLTLGVTGVLAKPINQPPKNSIYRSVLYPCESDNSQMDDGWDGDIYYVRNSILRSLGASENPPFDVKTVETLSWNFNLLSAEGYLWGPYTQIYTSDNYEEGGLWKGFIAGRIYMSEDGKTHLVTGIGEFYGEGLFEGLRMKSTWDQETISEDERNAVCPNKWEEGVDPELKKTIVKHHVIGAWPPAE
jgi:hypothetical protein